MYQNKGIKGSGGPQHKGSIHAAHPAVAGLNLTTHEISVGFVLKLSKLWLCKISELHVIINYKIIDNIIIFGKTLAMARGSH